ncbi:hypothetical protein [Rhodococcus sp. IEGM 1406]|uniref:hypothetical protein n=1 Tax=Rhodococcus sp. IEGM 1406 TaxID=3047083 RepID=UPI0024B65777|nr:hypothetical protein [Rhodococcus sp. IEGM 1406]MDI9904521.1 hypothetical protein [Rhodococcus sp. IEGM 1406]
MEPLEPMRPVSVAVDTRTKTPLWKMAVLYPAVTSVFMFAALTTRTGIGLVVLGLVIFAVGASTYAMSERRMLRENSGVRVPYFAGPPVAPRHVDILAAAGMPLLTSGAVLTVRASDTERPWVFISVFVIAMALAITVPMVVHNVRAKRTESA